MRFHVNASVILGLLVLVPLSGCSGGSESNQTRGSSGGESRGEGGTTPLLELLGKLPRERWPKDYADSLKYEQATAWLKDNVIGQRVSFSGVKARKFKFKSEGGGTYRATGHYDEGTNLYGLRHYLTISDVDDGLNDHGFKVSGLSEKDAEKLRAWPEDKPLELTFKIQNARIFGLNLAGGVMLTITDIAIIGLE
jgi:hypothetical protein